VTQKGDFDMRKLAPVIAVAAGLLALGACNRTPAENKADNARDAAANQEEAYDNQAATIRENADNQAAVVENRGDAAREAGEKQADAIEANASNTTR
jgi:hypothetical protein